MICLIPGEQELWWTMLLTIVFISRNSADSYFEMRLDALGLKRSIPNELSSIPRPAIQR